MDDNNEPLDMAAVLNAKRRRTKTIPISLDHDVVRVFEFAGIGREAWEQMVDDHQPTDEQQDEHKQEQIDANTPALLVTSLRWNPDSFPPALIAASCIDPVITLEQAEHLWHDPAWSASDCRLLFNAALEVNDPMRDNWMANLPKGLPGIPSSGPNAEQPTTT